MKFCPIPIVVEGLGTVRKGLEKETGFGLVLWHINHCRLFNAKSIFIHINSSISNNLVEYKYSFLFPHCEMSKTVLFQAIQFSISTLFQYQKTVLFQTIQFSISK